MRRQNAIQSSKTKIYFNPRIHKGCDRKYRDSNGGLYIISIHASIKDATGRPLRHRLQIWISIHASIKDATQYTTDINGIVTISIHASIKDATRKLQRKADEKQTFQSTHP